MNGNKTPVFYHNTTFNQKAETQCQRERERKIYIDRQTEKESGNEGEWIGKRL